MRASSRLLAPGFTRRSLDELKRFTKIALTQEGIRVPTTPFSLLDFSDPDTVPACKTMSDADIGGFSNASLDQIPRTSSQPAHARFHGSISTDLPRNRPQVQRTGYAGWRNRDRPPTLFGKSLWDVDPYTYLALRVKSDGRKYFVNVQTESIVHTDLHQHRLHARKPGEWETVFIEINAFVRTNHGEVVEPQTEMMRQKVRTLGVSLTDRVPGPFDLAISRVWASNANEKDDESVDTGGLEEAV
ncbi:hypothetical protein HO173_004925 [Letharia columbiana]|uniref:NADH:ubiquinone oxidoreductase intermediate-associated protein 30 domain-containing protein n=1 Tax=Letharia columbiana TaxID=112416 RepID=A0A8H6FYB5_9LECA|nr:uncharacterized protein HO173_004925 [Letharia columbiana]KAF6237046.1 hypothetical protein HO173_004925 [Letharia columbiana]